jgi:hypothetical protein
MSPDSYVVDSDRERAMIAECERLGGEITPLVCEDGHVHIVFKNWTQVILTPDQAETAVAFLYDAAQEAAAEAGDE